MSTATNTPANPAGTYPPISDETALRYARMGLVPMERLELLHYLGYPETLPHTREDRVAAVYETIMARKDADAAAQVEAAYRRGWDDRGVVHARVGSATPGQLT